MFTTPRDITPPPMIDTLLTHRDKALFIMWHIKLGHTPFQNLCWAAKLSLLLRKLQNCQNMVCPAWSVWQTEKTTMEI